MCLNLTPHNTCVSSDVHDCFAPANPSTMNTYACIHNTENSILAETRQELAVPVHGTQTCRQTYEGKQSHRSYVYNCVVLCNTCSHAEVHMLHITRLTALHAYVRPRIDTLMLAHCQQRMNCARILKSTRTRKNTSIQSTHTRTANQSTRAPP